VDPRRDRPPPNLRLLAGGRLRGRAGLPGAPAGEDDLDAALAALRWDAVPGPVARSEAEVFAIVRRYTRTGAEAGRLAERTFEQVFRAAREALRKDPERAIPLRRWLLAGALRIAALHLREEARLAGGSLAHVGPLDAPDAPPGEARRDPARVPRVRGDILGLPRRQRDVLALRLDAELPFPEVAEVLGITQAAAVANFHAACRRLRGHDRSCERYAVLLSLRAAGALDRGGAARVEGHLGECAACRAEAEAIEDVLSCGAVPAVPAAERRGVEGAGARALRALARADRRRGVARRLLLATAALVAWVVLGIGVLRGLPAGGWAADAASAAAPELRWWGL
jgi:RNA polymerase sigma-70 factor (ECF subfamily)